MRSLAAIKAASMGKGKDVRREMFVYLVYRSTGTTGDSHMVLDSIWRTKALAEGYVDGKPNLNGPKLRLSGETVGGWRIDPWFVHQVEADRTSRIREAALAKLSAEEKAALGLDKGYAGR